MLILLAGAGGRAETCVVRLGKVDVFYQLEDGNAVLGDGVSAVVTNASVPALTLPASLDGHPLVRIASNAFTGVLGLSTLEFEGPPVATVDDGAFAGPTNLVGYYSADFLDAWQTSLDGGTNWHGLAMVRVADCRTWTGLANNARDGLDAVLRADVTQDGDALAFGPSANGQIVFDLGGFDLQLADGKRLATVASNDCFVLSGSGRVIGGSAASVDVGGAVYVAADGRFALAGPTITNAAATYRGGAVYVAEGGLFNFSSGAIVGCTAPQGGGVATHGEFLMKGGELVGNRSTLAAVNGGGGLYVNLTGAATVKGGVFSGNRAVCGGAACVYGGTLSVSGGSFTGNEVTSKGSVFSILFGGSVDVCGGVVTGSTGVTYYTHSIVTVSTRGGITDFATESVADGFAQHQLANGNYVTHSATNDFITTSDGAVMAGTFTFDPRDSLYTAAGLEVLNECEITMSGEEPTLYTAKIVQGGPYTATVDGRTWVYGVLNGKAVLGDGTNPATEGDPAAETLRIPGSVNGFAVDALASNAFTNFTSLAYVVFEGEPPSTVGTNVFPAAVMGTYASEHAASWEAVIHDGQWNGITMVAGLSPDWATLKANLEAGESVTLVRDIAQDGDAVAFASGTAALDLNGCKLTGVASKPLVAMTGGALTVRDAVGTGAAEAGRFEISGGAFVLDGGAFGGGLALGGTGVAAIRGGSVLGGFAVSGGCAVISGGTLAGGSAAAIQVTGGAPIVEITGGRFSGADGAWLSSTVASPNVKVWGGVFSGEVAAASLARGYAAYAAGDVTVVAQEGTFSRIGGIVTAGIFTFDPSKAEYGASVVSDPTRQTVTATGGRPATWTLTVRETVTCSTWEELRANVAVGNTVASAISFAAADPMKMPAGFVCTGRAFDDEGPAADRTLAVTVRVYADATASDALWCGRVADVKTDATGTYALWLDDTVRTAGDALTNLFATGTGLYYGVAFDDARECAQRRAFRPLPLAVRALAAAAPDASFTAALYDGRGGAATCDTLVLSNALCGSLELVTSNTSFRVAEADVGGVRLRRDPENRIVSRTPTRWVYRTVKTGDTLVENVAKSALVTLQSTNDCSVPLLTFPVPTGGTFTWRSTPFAGRYRVTYFGE